MDFLLIFLGFVLGFAVAGLMFSAKDESRRAEVIDLAERRRAR